MTTRKFLRFTYAAIKRYGDKTWTAHTGVVEFNPTYTAYIVELSNGTKFLCFINDYCGPDDYLLSERGETANSYAAKSHHDKVKQNIRLLNNTY